MRRINRKVIALATAIILALVLLEIYAHNYVQIQHLPTLMEEQALKSIPTPHYYNYTYTFSSEGASWLVAFQGRNSNSPSNFAHLYIFKIGQNLSFPIQSIDLLILGIRVTPDWAVGLWSSQIDYENNCTVVVMDYLFYGPGTFHIDFGLQVRIYQETVLGLIPKEDMEIPVNATLSYG